MAFGRAVAKGTPSLLVHPRATTKLKRVLDLLVPPQHSVSVDSRGYEMSLGYMLHKGTIDQWARQHKGLDPITLPNGGGFGREHVRRSSHNATPSTRQVPTVRRWQPASG